VHSLTALCLEKSRKETFNLRPRLLSQPTHHAMHLVRNNKSDAYMNRPCRTASPLAAIRLRRLRGRRGAKGKLAAARLAPQQRSVLRKILSSLTVRPISLTSLTRLSLLERNALLPVYQRMTVENHPLLPLRSAALLQLRPHRGDLFRSPETDSTGRIRCS
jgi:hypothetical protein